jgi:hypothetical protein
VVGELREVGLTHSTWYELLGPDGCPDRRLTPAPARPKRLLEGGVWSKLENATTHPVAEVELQAGMC